MINLVGKKRGRSPSPDFSDISENIDELMRSAKLERRRTAKKQKDKDADKQVTCKFCLKKMCRLDTLKRHVYEKHNSKYDSKAARTAFVAEEGQSIPADSDFCEDPVEEQKESGDDSDEEQKKSDRGSGILEKDEETPNPDDVGKAIEEHFQLI